MLPQNMVEIGLISHSQQVHFHMWALQWNSTICQPHFSRATDLTLLKLLIRQSSYRTIYISLTQDFWPNDLNINKGPLFL